MTGAADLEVVYSDRFPNCLPPNHSAKKQDGLERKGEESVPDHILIALVDNFFQLVEIGVDFCCCVCGPL